MIALHPVMPEALDEGISSSDLLVFSDDWGRHPSSCQHLVRHLMVDRKITWVNTIGTRPPRFDLSTLWRGLEKVRAWSAPDVRTEPTTGPTVLNPRMWPWFRSSVDRRLNRTLLLRALRPALEAMSSPPTVVTTLPIVADLIGHLPVARWIYYCVDDLGVWPGLDGATLRTMEQELVGKADVIVAAGEVLRDGIARLGRTAHLLTHGIDPSLWSEPNHPLPAGFADLPRPLCVFWGSIDRRIDVPLVVKLAESLEQGTVLLVGPQGDADPALRKIPRVALRPALAMKELSSLAREAAVMIMPYADLPVTRAIQPLKLKEYLASGRPAVVRDLPANRGWADCLDLASTPEQFAQAVRLRLTSGLPPEQSAARRTRLAGEDWSAKTDAFVRMIEGPDSPHVNLGGIVP